MESDYAIILLLIKHSLVFTTILKLTLQEFIIYSYNLNKVLIKSIYGLLVIVTFNLINMDSTTITSTSGNSLLLIFHSTINKPNQSIKFANNL
jgi:hypothetical protein